MFSLINLPDINPVCIGLRELIYEELYLNDLLQMYTLSNRVFGII